MDTKKIVLTVQRHKNVYKEDILGKTKKYLTCLSKIEAPFYDAKVFGMQV